MIEFAISVAPATDQLLIGFLDPLTQGSCFDSLQFQVFVEGNLEVDETFFNAADADAFFDDQLLTISSLGGSLVGDLDLKFQFDLTASTAGDGYFTNFVVGTVPIPATVWLFGSGLLGLVGMAGRRKTA